MRVVCSVCSSLQLLAAWPDLHSFPTRRSSDLCGAHRLGHATRLIEDPELTQYVNDRRIGLEICLTSNVQTHAAKSYETHPLDRKSTRLNSSHLVISYAVFCLKKIMNMYAFHLD